VGCSLVGGRGMDLVQDLWRGEMVVRREGEICDRLGFILPARLVESMMMPHTELFLYSVNLLDILLSRVRI
jgi:hypothetical protein